MFKNYHPAPSGGGAGFKRQKSGPMPGGLWTWQPIGARGRGAGREERLQSATDPRGCWPRPHPRGGSRPCLSRLGWESLRLRLRAVRRSGPSPGSERTGRVDLRSDPRPLTPGLGVPHPPGRVLRRHHP